ncbi:MAG: hypothetical protein ACREAK_00760 [Nitrosarchaeum sp.]
MQIMFELFPKKTKKQRKREVLAENRRKGKAGEDVVAMNYRMNGYEVEKTGRGHDLRVRQRDWLTGKVIKSKVVEVKTGKAKLSKLQRKTRKKQSNYKVERVDPYFY